MWGISVKKKLLLSIVAIVVVLSSFGLGAYAAVKYSLIINGKTVKADIKVINGKPYIPVSALSGNLKDTIVQYDPKKGTIKIDEKKQSLEPVKSEKLAIDYINIYLNGSDLQAKKKFIDQYIHPDVQSIFRLFESTETPQENKFLNYKYQGSADYKDGSKQYKAFLFTGELNSAKTEIIILSNEGKIVWVYSPSDDDPKIKKAFEELRARFK